MESFACRSPCERIEVLDHGDFAGLRFQVAIFVVVDGFGRDGKVLFRFETDSMVSGGHSAGPSGCSLV